MRRLWTAVLGCIILLPGIWMAPILAVSQGSPGWTHLAYVFAHAGIIHWAVNSWALLVIHNIVRWYRLLAAYVTAVAVSFLPYERPLVGMSAITVFFFAIVARRFWTIPKRRIQALLIAALVMVGLFIPSVAGLLHIAAFGAGLTYIFLEDTVRSIHSFVKEEK